MQWTMRGRALFPSTRIRTAPQFPHLHSTVGLGVSSAGGAVGTVSTRGAGTTLRVFVRRVGIAATRSGGRLAVIIGFVLVRGLFLAAKHLFLAAKHAVACMSQPRVRFPAGTATAPQALAVAAATHVESALLNAISVHRHAG